MKMSYRFSFFLGRLLISTNLILQLTNWYESIGDWEIKQSKALKVNYWKTQHSAGYLIMNIKSLHNCFVGNIKYPENICSASRMLL